jgi:YHS domain-containing protein
MSFLGRVLRFLFWLFVVSWVVKLFGRVIREAQAPAPAPARQDPESAATSKRLVKDPVCGMHMAKELALPLNVNGEVLHFCSEQCRAKYQTAMVRRAASA